MNYNTGNPVPSTDPRDLYDNAGNLDQFANGPEPFYPDRLGRQRLSLSGMQQDFNNAQEGRQDAFDQFLAASAFIWIGDYGPGLTFTSRSEYTVRDGYAYRLAAATTVPYVTSGNWPLEQEKFALFTQDDILRLDLAAPGGASLVSYGAETVAEALDKAVRRDSPSGAASLPAGTTGQRPATPMAGMIRYNSTTAEYERYQGGNWLPFNSTDKAFNEAPPVELASAATVNVGAAASNTVNITGTVAITSLGSFTAGAKRLLLFQGALTLTHNAASLILPGGVNITTAAGDTAEFVSFGANRWRCMSYQRATGEALVAAGLGQGQTWQDLTASRALGTTYTNSTGKPISVSGYVNNSSSGRIAVTIGGVVVWNFMAASGIPPMPFTAVIPAGATYSVSVTAGTATLAIWAELR